MVEGKPEAISFCQHEFVQYQSSLVLVDPGSIPVLQFTTDNLSQGQSQG
jgi:hypothetical protein